VCRFGSPARVSQWSNAAPIIPLVFTWAVEPVPVRVNRNRSSRNASAWSTASRCAARTASWTLGWARAQRVEADFGAVNVRSKPATAPRWGLASSTFLIRSTAAVRSSAVIDSGRWATASLIRSVAVRNTGYARPSGSPVVGWRPVPNRFPIASSVTTAPTVRTGAAAPSGVRPARPVPTHRPGGYPDSV